MVRSSKTVCLGLIFAISLLGQFTLIALGDSFGTNMNVKDEPPNSLWWMRGSTPSGNGPELEYADKLIAFLGDESRSELRVVYGNCFVNPGNATLFIVLTRCDAETITMFNEALNPPPGVHLVYRTGPATYEELERYMDELGKIISKLPRDVVEVNSYGITENATLFVGIGKITMSSVNAFADAIRGVVPEELIVIRRDYAAQLASISVKAADSSPGQAADSSRSRIPQPIDMGILAVAILLPLLLLTIARKHLPEPYPPIPLHRLP